MQSERLFITAVEPLCDLVGCRNQTRNRRASPSVEIQKRTRIMARLVQMMRTNRLAATLFYVVATAVAVHTANSGASAQESPAQQTAPPQKAPQDPRSTQSDARPGETLSDRLDRTHGVIRPPAEVSPDMPQVRPPEPDPGTTPVIPPPGSPGGNPQVQPK